MQVYVAIFVIKEEKLLLVKHSKKNENFFTLPGGKVEPGELCIQAAIRESYEEVGIIIEEKDLIFAHAMSRKINNDTTSMIIFFEALNWKGEPFNKETNKHEEVGWYHLNDLPLLFRPHHNQALIFWKNNIYYSEFK